MKDFGPLEKMVLIGAVFFFSTGIGLIVDGKKLFMRQLQNSEQVAYRNTLNPY
jgi:hypothetical protein